MALPTTGLFKIYQTKLYPVLDEYLNFMFRVCMVLMPQNRQEYIRFIPSSATNSLRDPLPPLPLGRQDTNHSLAHTVIVGTQPILTKKSDSQIGSAIGRVRSTGLSLFYYSNRNIIEQPGSGEQTYLY